MKHPYFKDVPWDDLLRKGTGKRWISYQPGQENHGLGNFDRDFTSEPPKLLTPRPHHHSNNYQSVPNEPEPNNIPKLDLGVDLIDPFDDL